MSKLQIVALLLLLGLVGAVVWRSGGAPGEATETVANTSVPRYHIDGLKSLRTDDKGQPLVRLTAVSADYFDGGAAHLTGIEAIGLSGEAAPWALKSPVGTVAAGEKRLLLQKPVTGTGRWNTGEPFAFNGSAVFVDENKRQFYSSEPITIDSATRTARAQGFTAGFDGKTLNMTKPELSYVLGD